MRAALSTDEVASVKRLALRCEQGDARDDFTLRRLRYIVNGPALAPVPRQDLQDRAAHATWVFALYAPRSSERMRDAAAAAEGGR